MHWKQTWKLLKKFPDNLRLRDLGGIIVVDFIDMKLPENKRKLMEAMEEFMRPDRAKHAVLPISKFGLMQITRQRMKPEMNINTQEVCPSCLEPEKYLLRLILEDEIEKNLSYLLTHQHKDLTLVVHPIMHAYLTKGACLVRTNGNGDGNMARRSRSKKTPIITSPNFIFSISMKKK